MAKILVVEDELPLLKVLVDRLSKEGFTILAAKDGQEGLELALKEVPDLILLDILMPKIDGMTMLRKLRESGKNMPVILLTNAGETSKILEAKEYEAATYLIKSNFKIEDVVKIVYENLKFFESPKKQFSE